MAKNVRNKNWKTFSGISSSESDIWKVQKMSRQTKRKLNAIQLDPLWNRKIRNNEIIQDEGTLIAIENHLLVEEDAQDIVLFAFIIEITLICILIIYNSIWKIFALRIYTFYCK